MKVFVLSCEWGDQSSVLGVFTSLASALETLTHQWLEQEERIEDFIVLDEQHNVVSTNMTDYRIDEHILEGVNK